MKTRLIQWKNEILVHKKLIGLSLLFLTIAMILNYVSGTYVERRGTVPIPDLILDNIPTLDLDFFFIYGFTFIVLIFFLYPLLFNVKMLHVTISQFSLLVLIRSFFVSLTHLSMPVNAMIFTAPKFFEILDFKNALFFSGHTAIPFLGFLLFRKEKIKIFFLFATMVMALTVLFMHVHYSIDVFAALFITYGSYKIGEKLFERINDYKEK